MLGQQQYVAPSVVNEVVFPKSASTSKVLPSAPHFISALSASDMLRFQKGNPGESGLQDRQ